MTTKMKVSNYRQFLGYTQEEIAKEFNISMQAYSRKERGETPFNDQEKIKFKKMLEPHFPNITIDAIFFN